MSDIENIQKSKRGGRREGAGRKRKIGADANWDIIGYKNMMQTKRIPIPAYYEQRVIDYLNTLLEIEEIEDTHSRGSLRDALQRTIYEIQAEIKQLPKKKMPTRASVLASAEQGSLFDYIQKSS